MSKALRIITLAFALAFVIVNAHIISVRPMHHDEANQAIRFGDLLEGRGYRYDPHGHHGPTLYYATLPAAWIARADSIAHCTEATVRAVPLAATALLILLVGLQGAILGESSAVLASLLTAVSTPFVFYSTYYIQEPLLVLFATASLAAAARWRPSTPRSPWLPIAAFFLGLAAATKETWLITAFAITCAATITAILHRNDLKREAFRNNLPSILVSIPAFLLPAILLYSSFFSNWRGPLDAVVGLFAGASQSSQTDFAQPWHYFIQRLVWHKNAPGPIWTELPIIATAVIGAVLPFTKYVSSDKRIPLQFIVIYALAQFIVYSAIPYKTPWCILNAWQPILILAAAAFANAIQSKFRWLKVFGILLLIAVIVHQVRQTNQTCGRFCSDPRNPYVYSHTQKDLMRLVERIRDITADEPSADNRIIVATSSHQDAWPLPWYFRDRTDVEYRTDWPDDFPPSPLPTFIIASPDLEIDLKLDGYMWETHALRPNVFLFLGIQNDRWESWLKKRQPPASSNEN